MLRSRFFPVVAVMLASPSLLPAAKVKVWYQHTPAQFEKAQLKQTVVSSEGTLRLARHLRPLASLDASHVWDMVEDRGGNLYVATGNEGKIYKLPAAESRPIVVHAGEQSQVLCLAAAADGSIFAGTGPNGKVLRIDPRGQVKPFGETGESYVWSLAIDPRDGTVYAGTGPHGKIYRLSAEGKAEVFYTTRQDHILCLAAGGDGMLYAGTDKGGLVYRIDPHGKGFVLYQANQAEVHTLKVTPDAVYVGTSSPTSRHRGGSGGSSGRATTLSARETSSLTEEVSNKSAKTDKKHLATGKKATASEDHEVPRSNSAPAPSTPASGENSVYRIAWDGTVREVFREKAMILSLLHQGERFFVGTGMDGQLFEVNETTREHGEIARLDHGQILCMCRRQDGSIVLGTGDPGKLYVLRDKFTARGSLVSDVLDARIISKWGALRWEADAPDGTSVSVAVRSGNVADPDDTWSDWSAEQTDAEHATIAAPTARFLQYRVTLATTRPEATPAVRGVTLRYRSTNQAPEITKLETPNLNVVNLDNPKKIRFKWSAVDANEDDLNYRVLVRKEGWKNWVELEDDLDKTEYEWDTTTTPSGVYRMKVVVGDRKDNSEGEALNAERISLPFVVCHEAPAVTVKTVGIEGDRVILEASARSPLARLTASSFAVNGKKWTNLFPADGLFDSKSESFRFTTEGLKPGTYVLVLRVRDAAGNTGSADAVFNVKPK